MADNTALDKSRALLSSIVVEASTEADLTRFINKLRGVEAAVDQLKLQIACQANRLHERGLSGTAAEVLSRNGDVPREKAKREAARAQAVASVPGLELAFTSGQVSAGHLDVIARKTRGLKPDEMPFLNTERLLSKATTSSPDQFERAAKFEVDKAKNDWGLGQAIREREVSELKMWRDRKTGMGHIHAVLDPERFDAVRGMINREVSSLATNAKSSGESVAKNEGLAADAFVALLDRGNASASGGSRPHVSVIVDSLTALSGAHEHSVRETSYGTELPPESIQRHLCDSVIQPILVENGLPTKVGRSSRTATNAQWVALRSLYRSCGWKGCDSPVEHCQAHHVEFWEGGGPTDLANLVPLCSHHHHRVHEGKWGLVLKPDRTLEIRRPDGPLWATVKPDRLIRV